MDDTKAPAAAAAPLSLPKQKLCQECRLQPFLYQCPKCSRRTCSLACCKAHKARTGCNGKRDRTTFLPLGRMDDSTVTSDFHFLEDVLGQVESGKRLLQHVGCAGAAGNSANSSNNKRQRQGTDSNDTPELLPDHPILQVAKRTTTPGIAATINVNNDTMTNAATARLPAKWRHVQQACTSRGVNVLFMPPSMERHKTNQSHVKKDVLYWTVEWNIHSENGTEKPCSILSKLSEQAVVRQAVTLLQEQQQGTKKSVLQSDNANYSILIKRLPCPSNQPVYHEVSESATLATALRDLTVLEYPTIEVVPAARLSQFPRAIETTPTPTTTNVDSTMDVK